MSGVAATHTGALVVPSDPWQFHGQITWASDIDPVVLPANQPVLLRLAFASGGLDTSSMSISFGSTGTGRSATLPAAGPFTSGTDYTVASHKDRTVTYTITGVGPASPGAFAMRARSENYRLDLYTGSAVSWTIPAGCRLDIGGAAGQTSSHPGGRGGRLTGDISAGDVEIRVGGVGASGSGGWNGGGDAGTTAPPAGRSGGGGGATDLRMGGSTLSDRVVVAGGGGGGGLGAGTGGIGGDGGGTIGAAGQGGGGPFGGSGGAGGTSSTGYALGAGGPGAPITFSPTEPYYRTGAGGGGGYYGGFGGGTNNWSSVSGAGAGGGGSGFVDTSIITSPTWSTSLDAGYVLFAWGDIDTFAGDAIPSGGWRVGDIRIGPDNGGW